MNASGGLRLHDGNERELACSGSHKLHNGWWP